MMFETLPPVVIQAIIAAAAAVAVPVVVLLIRDLPIKRQADKFVDDQFNVLDDIELLSLRTKLKNHQEQQRFDRLVTEIRKRGDGVVRLGHLLWISDVLHQNDAAEPYPDFSMLGLEAHKGGVAWLERANRLSGGQKGAVELGEFLLKLKWVDHQLRLIQTINEARKAMTPWERDQEMQQLVSGLRPRRNR